ncbi:hypothetical protein B0H14DRAFT_3871440 [Mycena olivaceomarginata]|nr:hypothetical protein B0H14DRAFT_3871440 [Mycena olivaceomarginata]
MAVLAVLFLWISAVLGTKPAIYTDLPCKFSLAAWNVSRHNDNSTGVPLVLGQTDAGAVADGASYEVTSTYASYPYNTYPTLSLSNGSMRAYRASGAWLTNATAVASGGPLTWYTSALFDRDAARIYTAHGHDLRLAAYGVADRWYLCPFSGTLAQTSVVFNVSRASSAKEDFDSRRCWKVRLHLVPVGSEKKILAVRR